MDAKKLKSGKKIESKLIPLLNNDNSVSNSMDSILSYFGKLNWQDRTKGPLTYAGDHLKDAGRVKEYTKIIADKWNMPDIKIVDAINCVIFYVKFPIFTDMYGAAREKPKIQKELSLIHKLIADIEAGSIKTLEITIKATGKAVPDDVHVTSAAIVRKIYECLKSLPKAEIKRKSKGRPKGVSLEIQMQRLCAKKIQETYSSLFKSQNDLFEFIGYCFVATGVYWTEPEWQDSKKYPEGYAGYLISNIKVLLKS